MALTRAFIDSLRQRLGPEHVLEDAETLAAHAADAFGVGHLPQVVVRPADTADVAAVATLCHEHLVPLVVRGAGTGYTGGAVPVAGGVVLSVERLGRILAIDTDNLLAVVQPAVITADLQREVERVGLFYPPDPASLDQCSIGGNVAECAGGPRAFKYGTTKRYVLALEVVLPTGQVMRTGSKAVKNVVGYDLTQLLVGSEGTLAIVTEATLRLVPKPPARAALSAFFPDIGRAVAGVTAVIRAGVVPAALELVDEASLRAVEAYVGERVAPTPAGALVIIECDGMPAGVEEEIAAVHDAVSAAGALAVVRARDEAERERVWFVRRQLSYALRATGAHKINHDVVVPRGRVPELFDEVERVRQTHGLRMACFGHAGDGNIHVNILIDKDDADQVRRSKLAEREIFQRVVALEGSITGEHGVGFTKSRHLDLELSPELIALMKRVKQAFDPHGILNPGKIFP
ncbi:MAG TPA: FAD-linked oxidase C-terminal domain-containing protein [Vicinamibacterales bacterium]